MSERILNLMMIDENQLYAEKLVGLLSAYFDEVNLGFLDDREELIKSLRNDWDVLIFSRAYEMGFTDVAGILQEQGVSIPMIELLQEGEMGDMNEHGFPRIIDGDMIKTLTVGQDSAIVMATCLMAAYSVAKRQTKRLNGILKEAEQRVNVLINNSKSAVAYIDQGVHIFANTPYLEMFGYNSIEEIIGVPVVDIIATGDDVKAFKQFLRRFDKGDRSEVEFDFESKHTNGETFASKLQLASATYDGEPVVQMIIQQNDVNAAEIAKKLALVERQDPLTGLANRIGFTERLEQAYKDAVSGTIKSAFIYVSIDNIGKVNSSAGLAGVDTTIKYIANLLSDAFSEAFVARFSDATFALLLSDVKKDDALALAEKVRERAENSLIESGNRTITVTLSVGVVMMDGTAPDSQTILSRGVETVGDIYTETDGQGNKVRIFDISEHASEDEGALTEYIQNALIQNRFILKYQPAYDINTDSSDMFEVFVALPMADGTELTFDKFSQVAKKANLLDKIDRWVLINACKQLAQTRKTHPKANLLISLSPALLADANLTKMVTQLVKAVGEQGGHPITLQFHEQDLVDYLAVAKRQFMALTNIGCPVGVQSFGVTAKSEEIIAHLNPAMARLARSYTKDLDRSANMETVQKLVATASSQGVDVLMPYIEDAQTMSMAWSIGARFLQGNYLQLPDTTITYAEPEPEA